jgi:putative Mg2+ transporter-C (MgtC) family protein
MSFSEILAMAAGDTWLPPATIAARLGAAVVFGAVIGFEREWHKQPAGLRTHILVSLASATAALMTIEIAHMKVFNEESIRIDPIRLIEAVTAGVAFLAAGLIVFARGQVLGLTTGAGIWLVGAIGLATGLGVWAVAVLATLYGLIVLWLLRLVEERLLPDNGKGPPPERGDS